MTGLPHQKPGLAACLSLLLLAGSALAEPQVAANGAAPTAPSLGLPQVDPSVSPCDNFFLHACGPWIKANPIPSDKSRWGTFDALAQRNREILKDILEKAAAAPTGNAKKIGDFYGACMDEAAIASKGTLPMKPMLDAVDALQTAKDLPALVAMLHRAGINVFFDLASSQDYKDATRIIAFVDQAGLSMPDRDYYLKDDATTAKQRAGYEAHVVKMFSLLGASATEAAAAAKTVLAIETDLATGSMDRVARRDPTKTYNMRTVAELQQATPGFDFAPYFAGVKPPKFDTLNLVSPGFMPAVAKVLKERPLADIKTYLRWHVLHAAAPWLPESFVNENFEFFGKTMRGQKEIEARWQRCVAATDSALGENLGASFIEIAFPGASKERMLQLVRNVMAALNEEIGTYDWMGAETKAKARAKLAKMANKIGYPDKWRDYGAVTIDRADAFGNARRAFTFEFDRQIGKIGKPVDKTEWLMTPPTVNAYYDPSQNDINFPAGILQPPFFSLAADDAVNYGGIGAVIGHEATHGFDDQGSQFDENGNLNNWWTDEDGKRFGEKTQCISKQYGGYTAIDDVKLNGDLTLGENTADNGGVRMALKAYLKALGTKHDKLQNYTPEQRFFLGYAQIWCGSMTPETARLRAKTDPHSSNEFRVNGVVSNMPEFAAAFQCKKEAAMVRGAQACRVW